MLSELFISFENVYQIFFIEAIKYENAISVCHILHVKMLSELAIHYVAIS